MTEKNELTETSETENLPLSLPAELDNETVLFAYGSLLRHEKLKELLKPRGEFKILETIDAAEAAALAKNNPRDLVILKNVRLANVRVSILTETVFRRWYKNMGGELQALIDAEIIAREIPPALFLYARRAKPHEKGKSLNGGLICNLSKAELRVLDEYEWKPVLERMRAPELKIQERAFVPEHITFYAGTVSPDEITAEEKAERAGWLSLNRKRGEQSPQAKWHRNIRRK
jgi:hypothetical protein